MGSLLLAVIYLIFISLGLPDSLLGSGWPTMQVDFWVPSSYAGFVSMTISWSGDTLPNMVEWRSMAGGDYALGLEPTNCYIMGRKLERENGTLPVLKAFESIRHTVEIRFE